MALDINGYNSVFKAFVDIAQQKADAGKQTAVINAKVKQNQPLEGRAILSLGTSKTDHVHNWLRSNSEYAANDRTRTIFRNAVANMFGGESKIPADVKKAMLLGDYDCGKPLTARRILAVKQAIDANGVAKARSAQIKLETFVSPEVKSAALGMGYMKSELPKLARAAHFYAEAKGVSEMDAMREVGRPGSEANRLMNYGGRFLENASNFQDGLRLISQFSDWHDGLSSIRDNIQGSDPSYAGLDTPSKVNVDVRASHPRAKLGLERFIFEDIATNPDFNLAEMDSERAFGVEHNQTSRYMTVANNVSILGTIANVPPEKRRAVYAAFNAFQTLAQTGPERGRRQSVGLESIFLARVIRNLPKLESILAKTGTLTGRDVIKTCFPDIRNPGNYDTKTIEAWENELSRETQELEGADSAAVMGMLESGGATFQEAVNALDKGKSIPTVPYFSTAQYSMQEASSVAVSGLKTMNDDICRNSTYKTDAEENAQNVFPAEKHAWKFSFPDGERIETSGAKQADVPRVGEKIKNLCGEVHQKQIGTVAFLLSQAGTSVMRSQPLAKYGIVSDEHCPVDFALSRNAKTGAVTITYTSPKELPVKFSWTATVGIDGKVTGTPFAVSDFSIRNIDQNTAKSMVKDAAKAMGRKLNGTELARAADIFMRNAEGLWQKNAKLFAQFVAKLPLGDAHAARSGQKADAFAKEIKEWGDFDLGDSRVSEVANAMKADSNNYIAEKMAKPSSFGKDNRPDAANVFSTMVDDSNRSVYVINGERFDPRNSGGLSDREISQKVIAAFKGAVPSEKAQKALSCLMQQGTVQNFVFIAMKAPADPGTVPMHQLPGANLFASRDMMTGNFMLPLLDDTSMNTHYTLDVAPDGNTATVTLVVTPGLTEGSAKGDNFGQVQLTRQMTVDLRPDVPVVTDVKVAQTLIP